MKKLILLIAICITASAANAQVFVENFETAPVNGNLEGYNNWYVSPKAGDDLGVSPKIDEFPLFYSNYPGTNIGHVAVLDSAVGATSATQRISTKRIIFAGNDTLKVPATGAIYTAFIVNIDPVSYRSYRDFFTYEGSETSSFTRGRVFAKNNAAGDEVVFSISKNSTTATVLDESSTTALSLTLGTGINHLLIVKYAITEGASNDVITLFINPDPTKTEAQQANKVSTTDSQSDYSTGTAMKINLRQRGIGAQVGGIRVGKTWEAVVMGQTSGLNQTQSNFHNIYAAGKDIISGKEGQLKVYSLSGLEILSEKTEGKFTTKLNTGLYLVRFTDNSGIISFAKVRIQ
jgi:hypothetical protein